MAGGSEAGQGTERETYETDSSDCFYSIPSSVSHYTMNEPSVSHSYLPRARCDETDNYERHQNIEALRLRSLGRKVMPDRGGLDNCGIANKWTANYGTAKHDTANHGTAKHDTAKHDTAKHDTANYNIANYDTSKYEIAKPRMPETLRKVKDETGRPGCGSKESEQGESRSRVTKVTKGLETAKAVLAYKKVANKVRPVAATLPENFEL